MSSNASAMIKETENESHFAKQAFGMMQKHAVPPSPENYAVWFHYAKSANPDLTREVNAILAGGAAFSQENCSYLYNKYVLANRGQKAVDNAAGSAQKVLTEVLRMINDFSGETQEYNENVDQYIETIGQKFAGTGVESIVRELITATAGLKKS